MMVIKMHVPVNARRTKTVVMVPLHELEKVCCKKCMEKINEPG
jgi:hypothetical protein